jgi:hypothetical protein
VPSQTLMLLYNNVAELRQFRGLNLMHRGQLPLRNT